MVLGVIVLVQWQTGQDAVSAKTVAERAEAAQQSLVSGLGPDTTLHAEQTRYKASNVPPGPFVLPERTHGQFWVYLGADGKMADYRSESYDSATGTLVQTGALVDGQIVITDVASGETQTLPFAISADSLIEQFAAAQIETALLVEPDAAVQSEAVAGVDTYVVDMAAGGQSAIRRTYIDKATYRTVKWELLNGGVVVESRETPVFEVLPGRAAPAPWRGESTKASIA